MRRIETLTLSCLLSFSLILFLTACASSEENVEEVERLPSAETPGPSETGYTGEGWQDPSTAEVNTDEESPIVQVAHAGADLITQQYAISIPAEEKRLYSITYDSLYGGSDDLNAGMRANVLVKGETDVPDESSMAFQVIIISDNWGPQGAFYSRSLGHPSNMPGSTVYVLQPVFGSSGNQVDDLTSEYAAWVTVF